MKNNVKKYTLAAIIYASIFAIYTIIVMFAFSDKNNVFWLSYVFMIAGFAANVAVMLLSFKKHDVEAAFFGIPLISFSIFYFFAELFVSFIFMLFRNNIEIKFPAILQTIFLLIFVIFASLALLARTTVEEKTQNVKEKVSEIKNLSVDVKVLEDGCLDRELKAELHKISEAIRFSDPMTNDSVADLDNMIRGKVSELKMYCNSNSKYDALQACYQLSSFISERNMRLIQSK